MKKSEFDAAQVNELLYQALETEIGGVQVYETALRCAVNDDLRKEWNEYLDETRRHVQVLTRVFETLGMDTDTMTPGRKVVKHQGESLVEAMEMALSAGDPTAAELVACECVVLAETKDHSNWELIGVVGEKGQGDTAKVLKAAYDSVEQDEDHHLYHTMGWCRELWIQSLGFPAVLPPPEEVRQVETAIGASRAEQARDQMSKH
ncbi:MAG TPA: ferritin-like domain-containing protein [Xanthomonadaceae bacterium]|nr:ferritin-like domain-containing protein [Xanthomonadaceae bacterium]